MRSVLITGGCRGLGANYARALVRNGYKVAIIDRSPQVSSAFDEFLNDEDISSYIWGEPDGGFIGYGDLTDSKVATDLISKALDSLGTIDVVIANAGGDIPGESANAADNKPLNNTVALDLQTWKQVFDRNYYTVKNTFDAIVPHFKEVQFGKLIAISSISALGATTSEVAYASAKNSLLHLSKCYAKTYLNDGISSNVIILGPTKTGRFIATLKGRTVVDKAAFESSTDRRLGRAASYSDVLAPMTFLVSSDSDFMTGGELLIDGGWSLYDR